ncbi:unnamed protein product [Urochloa humidicola]
MGRPTTPDVPCHSKAQQSDGAQFNEDGAQPMDVDDQRKGCSGENPSTVQQPQIADLFTVPEPPLLSQPPQQRQRARRTFDMTAVRRSARLARKPQIPSVEKAQRNLYRKLGVSTKEFATIEQVLQQYVDDIEGPLPESIITALTSFLDLEDAEAELMTEALVEQAGEGLEDLQQVEGAAIPTAA